MKKMERNGNDRGGHRYRLSEQLMQKYEHVKLCAFLCI